MFFHIRNSLALNKGLIYMSITPKGKTEGVLTFIVPVGQCCMALNGVHNDASHQAQQRTLAFAQERFWWPMMAEDCCAIVRGCLHCRAFEEEVPRAPLCPIRAYAPLELVHLDYTSIESTMELNRPPVVKNVLVITNHFTKYILAVVTKDQTAKTVTKVFYEHFIAVFGAYAYAEAHLQMNCKAEKQKWYYDRTTSTAQLVPGDVVLIKNDVYQGKQKVKDQWSET